MTYQDTIEAPARVEHSSDGLVAPSALVQVFSWSAFLFFAGALTHPLGIGSDDEASGPFLMIAGAFYGGAALLLLHDNYRSRFAYFVRSNPAMLLALGVLLASVLWSIDPATTLRRSIAVVGTTLSGVLIGLAYSRYQLAAFIRRNLAAFIILSVLVAVVLPSAGTHIGGKFDGQWRGLMSFKNQMGWMTAMFLIFWLDRANTRTLRDLLYLAPLALGLLLLFRTGSATGILVAGLGLSALFSLKFYMASHRVRLPMVVLGLLGSTVLVLLWDSAMATSLELVGRSSSLTGRTSIWAAVLPFVEDKIWLGHGYSAFWANPVQFFGADSWLSELNHSHNAYIEIAVDLGIVGLATQGVFIVALLLQLWKLVQRDDPQGPVMLAAFVSLLLIGMVGVLFFRPNTGTWLMIVAFSAYVTERRRLSREPSDVPT